MSNDNGGVSAMSAELDLAVSNAETKIRAEIIIWGCLTNASVWAASDQRPLGFALGGVWIALAGCVLWLNRR